jgi:hypothetical protein
MLRAEEHALAPGDSALAGHPLPRTRPLADTMHVRSDL